VPPYTTVELNIVFVWRHAERHLVLCLPTNGRAENRARVSRRMSHVN